MNRLRIFLLIFAGAAALCIVGLRLAGTQSGLRRITNTTEEGININPSVSGDGRILGFESTEDIAGAGGSDHFRAIRANIVSDPATFTQMGGSRAAAPAISQDGSRIAFASKDDPLGMNADGNSEIFLFDGAKLTQVTNTSPGDIANRVANGNFQPSISDDGRYVAFSSNRDLAGQNADGNLEIFIYDSVANTSAQLTNSSANVGCSDAKISGNGASVAYIRDSGSTPSAKRDLLEQPRVGSGPAQVLAAAVQSLLMTYGRAISDDGTRIVYSAETATNTTQVFLYDGRGGNAPRQITSLGARVTEVPLHPTISGDGNRIAFATRRSVAGAASNSDGSVELYVTDIPSATFSKITNAPSSATGDVVSSLNDDGSIVVFSFPRVLSGAVSNSDFTNDSEIYSTGTPARPPFGTLTVLNGASFGNEPSTTKAVAPDSIAIARGGALANTTQQSQRQPNGTFPTNVGGTTVTVNGRAAQIFFVSPGQVNFLVPPQTEIGTADVVVTNSEGFQSRGSVPTLRAAPGVFTKSGDGTGEGMILNSDTLQPGPFDPSNGNLRLTIFSTGARNASQTVVSIGGRVVNAESVIASPDMPGLDEVRVLAPADLRGAGTVDLFVQSDGRASNPVAITFTGDGTRDVLINEVLVDPPTGTAGDANHDGVRDSSDDEFVELVNTTSHDINIASYQLQSRSSSSTTDTLRHAFAAGTILPACSAIVVFGGGTFDPNNSIFGGAQVVKASSSGLSLTNSGGVITLRDSVGGIITVFSYGGSTGLAGDQNQSLTRSPDVTGNFVLHQSASGSGGRLFSPGTRVNGAAFAVCPTIARIDVSPSSATIDAGAKQQFTAKAFDSGGNEVSGVIFNWQSGNTNVATIDQNGLATSSNSGSTEIRASGRGVTSAPATLTVRDVQRVLTRIDVLPSPATIPATGAQQFTAHGFDQFGNEIAGLTFTWESSNTNTATIDQTGLATGINQGQTTIKATSQSVSGTATLNVTAPTIVVNEVLADPPTGTEGDANHDGTRDSSQDEFVELVNSTGAGINIAGWTLRTHSTTSSTETVRHTFTAGTSVPASEAIAVFGGGSFNALDPLFGCSQVVKASTGGLSLTNTGLTILIRDASGNLITQFSYGGSTGLNGGNAQSLTRSPDITGAFVLHTAATGANGRKFSSGLKVDGTPFGNCPGHPATVTISPTSTSANVGQSTQFTAQAFDQFGRAMIGVSITFASENNTVATVDSTSTNPMTGVATANVGAHSPGTAHITATANDGTTTATSPQATLTVNGPALSISDVTMNEGNSGPTTFNFVVSLNQPASAGGVTFDISTQDGTATVADGDYVARTLTSQTIAAGSSTYAFDVTVNGDTNIESNETFLVNVTNVSGATVTDSQAAGTILNDDSPVLNINSVSANEGNSGTTTFTFTVTSTLPAPMGGITFDINTLDNSATVANNDYVARSLTNQTIPAGHTTYTFNVTVNGDTLVEADETFFVKISNASGGGASIGGTGQGTGTILNDDIAQLVISQVYGGGNNSGAQFQNDFVEIFNRGNTTVDFAVTPYSIQYASIGSNFGGTTASAKTNLTSRTIAPGKYFLVQESGGTTNGVPLPIADATGSIALAATSGKIALVAGTGALGAATCPGDDLVSPFNPVDGTIADFVGYGSTATTSGHCYEGPGPAAAPSNTTVDLRKAGGCTDTGNNTADFLVTAPFPRNTSSPANNCTGGAVPNLTINDVTVSEGNSGTTTATFTVSLSAPAQGTDVTFDIATQDNTATTANNDYVAKSLTNQIIPAGQTTYTFSVTINGDTAIEPDETFFVNVKSAVGATITDGQGVATIQNDDLPTLSINDVAMSEGNSGTKLFTFTVSLTSAAQAGGVTFDIATQDVTATVADNDYQTLSLTGQTITAGNSTKTFDVIVNGDLTNEPDETFLVNISNISGANPGDTQGQGTIQNDDTPTLSIDSVTVTEGNSGTTAAMFTVTLSPASTQTVTVNYATANGTAIGTGSGGTDYQSTSGMLTFTPGQMTQPITVLVNGDTTNEAICETFFVNLSGAVNANISPSAGQGQGGITDDDGSKLIITQIYGGGNNVGATFQNDFVELFNRGASTVDFGVTPYSVQYASAAGSFSSGNTINLTSGTVAPGQYFLIKLAGGTTNGAPLPTADATNTGINMSATDGKVALVVGTTVLSACPGATISDLIGYGSATCSEGTATAALSATKSARRTSSCVDTNNNSSDFAVVSNPAAPRNSASSLSACSCSTSYSSILILGGDPLKASLASLFLRGQNREQ